MEMNNYFLKKWTIYNDSDKKSKFVFRLFYDNKIHVTSLYKVRDEYKSFYSKEYVGVENYLDAVKIGEICLEIYTETIKRLKDFDKFIDMMEDVKHVDFQIDNEDE